MRAAIWTGGEPLTKPYRELLKECGLLIAADGGLTQLLAWDLTADLYVGDRDSWHGSAEDLSRGARESLVLETDKDNSDTEEAVFQAMERGADEIWLFGGSGLRMDHWLANLRLVES